MALEKDRCKNLVRNRSQTIARLALMGVLVLSVAFPSVPASTAISGSDVSKANSAIQSAFVLTFHAERNGGNVTLLVASLNSALQLVEKAQAENSTSPSQASRDLQSALQLAQNVKAESAGVSAAGSSLRKYVITWSVVSVIVILCAAVLAFAFGDRVFRWLWVRLYSDYVVRPANE